MHRMLLLSVILPHATRMVTDSFYAESWITQTGRMYYPKRKLPSQSSRMEGHPISDIILPRSRPKVRSIGHCSFSANVEAAAATFFKESVQIILLASVCCLKADLIFAILALIRATQGGATRGSNLGISVMDKRSGSRTQRSGGNASCW